MNFKTTLVLIVLLAVLGGVALFVKHRQPNGEEKPAVPGQIFDVASADISKLTITPSDGKKIAFAKSGTDWRITDPINAPADTFAVDRLTSAIAEIKGAELEEKPASTGLDQPSYVINFDAKDGSHQLKIGKATGVGDKVYVEGGNENKLRLASADILEQLQKPLKDYRQTRLLDKVSSSDIKQLTIDKEGKKLVLEKHGMDWELVSPEKIPAESSAVSDLTFAVTGLNASEFVNESEVIPALDPNKHPQLTVTFSETAPTTQPAATTQPGAVTVKFGGFTDIQKKNVFVSVSNPPALAIVPASSLESLQKTPLDLRDRKLMDVDPAQVSRIAIATKTEATTQPTAKPASHQELVIDRKKEAESATTRPTTQPSHLATTRPTTHPAVAATQPSTQPALPATVWALVEPKQGDASQSKVEALLAKFHPLRVDKYLPSSAATTRPSSTYTIQITAEIGGKTTKHVIDLIDPGNDKPLVGTYNGLTFEVPRTLTDSFTEDYTNKAEAPEPPAPKLPAGGGFPGFPGR